MDLYLYSAFLVLMTTQSALQYSFTFTQSHTPSYCASISSTLLFYEAQFGVQHLAQGHFGMQIFFFLGRLEIELPTFSLEDDHSTPSATAAPIYTQYIRNPILIMGRAFLSVSVVFSLYLLLYKVKIVINCISLTFCKFATFHVRNEHSKCSLELLSSLQFYF